MDTDEESSSLPLSSETKTCCVEGITLCIVVGLIIKRTQREANMSASIIALLSSPREKSNSTMLAQKIIEGAKVAGAKVESYYLHKMNISPCTACDKCK